MKHQFVLKMNDYENYKLTKLKHYYTYVIFTQTVKSHHFYIIHRNKTYIRQINRLQPSNKHYSFPEFTILNMQI